MADLTSGGPGRVRRRVSTACALLGVAFVVSLLASAAASAATTYSHLGQFGGNGVSGQPGLFHNTTAPQRLAVHQGTGKLFVADRGNHRVQVFNPTAGGAEFAFQVNVPAPVGVAVDQGSGDLFVTHGAVTAANEVQAVVITNATSGSYTLSFGGHTTDPIDYNANAAAVQTALRALPSINGANVNVTGADGTDASRTRTVTFVGTLAATDVDSITTNTTGLNGGAAIVVNTTTFGRPAQGHTIRKYNPNLSVNPTAYTLDGTFTSPAVGVGVGQIGALQSGANDLASPGGIAVDPNSGDILIADVGRHLIQRFTSSGAYVSSFNGASGGRPAFTAIKDLAVTSTGDIIVADVASNVARIDRFNSAGVLQATLSQNNNPVPNPSVDGNNSGVTVAVNASDEVFVSSVSSAVFFPTTPPSRVYQFENDALVADFTAPANFAGMLYGMAASSNPARLYVMAGSQFSGFLGAATPRVQVFRAAVPPTATLEDPTDVQGVQATFNGSVNPQGGETGWRFEYRPVGSPTWAASPVPNGNAGDGNSNVVVQTTATGLQPNTDYEVRLAAVKGDLVVIAAGSPKAFHTASVAPVIDTATASFIEDTSATLTGGVNPRNSQTDYWFEYGTDANYGQVAPADPVDAGSGATRVAVTQPIEGLQPGATYHFRIAAENEFGQESFGDDLTFTTPAVARGGLGPRRAYELTTQLPIDGRVLISTGSPTVASESGDGSLYKSGTTDTHIAVPGSDLPHKYFHSSRGADGWTAKPYDLPDPTRLHLDAPVTMPVDFSRPVATSTVALEAEDQNGVVDLYQHRVGGGLSWITRAEDSLSAEPGDPQTDAAMVDITGVPAASSMSFDGRTVVFASERRLLEADPNPSGAAQRLYKWTGDDSPRGGTLSLVSVRPDNSVPAGSFLGNTIQFSPHAVSRDGKRVFWRNGTTIYAHVEGEGSIEVGTGAYADATSDGSRVFYVTGGRAMAFDVDTETAHDLTGAAQVLGVTAVSTEGRRVYVVANAQLNDADPSPLGRLPSADGRNMYLLELAADGSVERTSFIASLAAADESSWMGGSAYQNAQANFIYGTSDVSPDGSVVAFASTVSLTGQSTGGRSQVFVYDADQHSLRCASCRADGSAPGPGYANAKLALSGADIDNGWRSEGYMRHVSSDGTVFFDTRTALTSEDLNTVRDVYEFRSGEVRLVSRGDWNDRPSIFTGASVDGRTMLMMTSQALVGEDYEDGVRKVYAARVGGGFPVRPIVPPCDGVGCEGELQGRPAEPRVGSDSVVGDGNARDSRPAAARVRVARVASSSAGATLVVRVSAAGRIGLSGARIRRVSRTVGKAGGYRVKVSLTAKARKQLARQGRVAVRMRVAFRSRAGTAASRTVTVRFKRSVKKPNTTTGGLR